MSNDSLPRFPSEADKIAREAKQFHQLSPSERWLAILDLIACGERLLAESPNRAQAERLRQEAEQQWRDVHKELFARHGH